MAERTAVSDALRPQLARTREALAECAADRDAMAAAQPEVRATIDTVLAVSDFVASACTSHPGFLAQLLQDPALVNGRGSAAAPGALRTDLTQVTAEAEAMSVLRRWRRHELARIAWRAIAGWAEETATLRELSAFA